MMADTGIGRILPTEVISPIQSYDRGSGSLHEDVGALRRERTLSVGQGMRKKGRGKQESAQPEMIVVVEQLCSHALPLPILAVTFIFDQSVINLPRVAESAKPKEQ